MCTGRKERVDLVTEVRTYGLGLCQSDLNRNNFMKDSSGRIVALDFGDCCFLPLSFMEFALKRQGDSFTHLIAPLVQPPKLLQFNPHDRRERVLLFVRSTFGTMTLISCEFEMVFTHDPTLVLV